MISESLVTYYAAARPDLPHPIEAPALVDGELVDCGGCGEPLAASEYDPDYDRDSDGWHFCGRRLCRCCVNAKAAAHDQ